MGFGQILFLLGAAAVIGPILIHLLIRPRFKRVPYTMIDFLEISQKQSRRTRRLRQWLILLMRCAIVVLLASMFALPFIKVPGQTAEPLARHFIVVDNSLSMTYQDSGRPLLDTAIDKAVQYVTDHRAANASFDVFTACGGRLGSQLAAAETIAALKGITPTARKAEMGDLYAEVTTAIDDGVEVFVYLVSDFTPAAVKALESRQSVTGLRSITYDCVAASEPANALVKDARVLRYRGRALELLVEVENTGQAARERLLTASVKGQQVELTSPSIPVAGSGRYVLKLDPGDRAGDRDFLPVEISLSPADALIADDTYYLGVQIEPSPQQRVLIAGRDDEQGFLVTEAFKAISRADFDNNLIVRRTTGPTLDQAMLDSSDILICGHIDAGLGQDIRALDRFLAKGGTAVFFASPDMSLADAQRLYQGGVIGAEPFEMIDERHGLCRPWPADGLFANAGLDVDTARATGHYTLDRMPLWSHFACRQHRETTGLWPIETGHYLIYALAHGAGKSLFVNTSMDDAMSTLTKRPVVIPLCRLILGAGGAAYGYGFHAEEPVTLPVFDFERSASQAEQGVWVLDPAGDRHRLAVTGSTLTAHYPDRTGWLRTLSDPARLAGINVATGETDLRSAESAEIDPLLAGFSAGSEASSSASLAGTSAHSNRPLWPLLAWIVAACVLIEGFIVNRIER